MRDLKIFQRKQISNYLFVFCILNYNKKYKHITLAERTIRQEIIMKLPNKETKTIAKTLDKIERIYRSKFIAHLKV